MYHDLAHTAAFISACTPTPASTYSSSSRGHQCGEREEPGPRPAGFVGWCWWVGGVIRVDVVVNDVGLD